MGLVDTNEAVEHFRRVIEATENDDAYNEGFIDALEFCIATLSTMPAADRWIPVGERLPEDGVDVLVTDDAGGMATIEIDCMESRESLAALGIDCAENYKKSGGAHRMSRRGCRCRIVTKEISMNDDLISRKSAIGMILDLPQEPRYPVYYASLINGLSAEMSEPLTMEEKRVFISAMTRETEVCEKIDNELAHQESWEGLADVCRAVVKRVKESLWT